MNILGLFKKKPKKPQLLPRTWDCGFMPGAVKAAWGIHGLAISGRHCGLMSGGVAATLCEDGTLTIRGAGAMNSWSFDDDSMSPWCEYEYRPLVRRAVICGGVTSIGSEAFLQCENLTSVEIADSVVSIEDSAFEGCVSLTSVTVLNPEPPEINPNAFHDVNVSDVCLYVPEEGVETYRAAAVWNEFSCVKPESVHCAGQ